MSSSTDTETAAALPAPIQAVKQTLGPHPDSEMHAIGLLMASILLILVLPLVPFVAFVWLVGRLLDGLRRGQPG